MAKQMLVNVHEGEECRIAILDGETLDNLYLERASEAQIVGNVYKARVAAVEQSLQAAFVDFGHERQGFLHISDVAPLWYQDPALAKRRDKARININSVLSRGQDLLVQVSKEGIRNKAPAVTTYVSLPGRYLVLMPYVKRHGVSKKISEESDRDKLRIVLEAIKPPEDMGVIIRTAAAGRPRRDVHRDLNYLLRLWKGIQKEAKEAKSPYCLYKESDLVIRIVRDVFSNDIDRIVVDNKKAHEKILQFMNMTMPASQKAVELYSHTAPLFTRYRVEEQIERIHRNRVSLPGGGHIVIEQTEALVAIDVNSGRFKREATAEDTAYKINLHAAEEIGRQIRLRDLGGLIICDFIDMQKEDHKRDVERKLYDQLKRDRARTKMLRMSRFGIIEMTRQRVRRNIEYNEYDTCPTCKGTGLVRNPESTIREALRRIRDLTIAGKCKKILVRMPSQVLLRMQNEKRQELAEIEKNLGGPVIFEAVPEDEAVDKFEIKCYKS